MCNYTYKELSCQHHYYLVESWCDKYIKTERRCHPKIVRKQYWGNDICTACREQEEPSKHPWAKMGKDMDEKESPRNEDSRVFDLAPYGQELLATDLQYSRSLSGQGESSQLSTSSVLQNHEPGGFASGATQDQQRSEFADAVAPYNMGQQQPNCHRDYVCLVAGCSQTFFNEDDLNSHSEYCTISHGPHSSFQDPGDAKQASSFPCVSCEPTSTYESRVMDRSKAGEESIMVCHFLNSQPSMSGASQADSYALEAPQMTPTTGVAIRTVPLQTIPAFNAPCANDNGYRSPQSITGLGTMPRSPILQDVDSKQLTKQQVAGQNEQTQPGSFCSSQKSKTSRRTRACQACRKMKQRCSGTQPCKTCLARGKTCQYSILSQGGVPQHQVRQIDQVHQHNFASHWDGKDYSHPAT